MNSERPPSGFKYNYCIFREDNNEELVEEVFLDRSWWRPVGHGGESSTPEEIAHLTWKCGDLDTQINYEPLKGGKDFYESRKSAHKLPNSVEIDSKSASFRHLYSHCKRAGLQIFEYVPLTFSFRLDEVEFQRDLQSFCKIFKAVERRVSADEVKHLRLEFDQVLHEQLEVYHDFNLANLPVRHVEGRDFENPKWEDIKLHDCYFGANTNMWILKPSRSDRGRGIEIFRSLEELEKFLQLYVGGCTMAKYRDICYSDQDTTSPSLIEGAIKPTLPLQVVSEFVIQKYLEKPALIQGYKFDIRPHGLLTQDRKLFLFKEMFGRVTSLPFSTQKMNYFAHLTNVSVGENSESYQKFVKMNILTHEQLAKFLEQHPNSLLKQKSLTFNEYIFEEITKIVKLLHESMTHEEVDTLNPRNIPNVFEVFGYDIILDESLRCWFIEANESPGLDAADSEYLQDLYYRVIEDLCKLTIDVIHPPPIDGTRRKGFFRLAQYPDEENLWVEIADYSEKKTL